MANGNEFSLPGSGYDIVKKILHAYALSGGKENTLTDIAQRAGMNAAQVSRNHGFLASVGIIEGGQKKKLTEKGNRLGIAVSHSDDEMVASVIREIVQDSEQLSSVLDMVRVQGSVPENNLAAKIGGRLGQAGGKAAIATGIQSLIDMLLESGLLTLVDGKYQANPISNPIASTQKPIQPVPAKSSAGAEKVRSEEKNSQPEVRQTAAHSLQNTPSMPIHVNLELHLPASAEQSVYDAIFRSIRQNLMEPVDGLSAKS